MAHQQNTIGSIACRSLVPALLFAAMMLMATTLTAQSPIYSYATSLGSTGTDETFATAVDESNNLYITGRFSGTVDFTQGFGPALTAANAGGDVYVASYDPGGTYRWAFRLGAWAGSMGIAFDPNGNLFLTGRFRGTVDFDPGSNTALLTATGPNGEGGFVAKYTPMGGYYWAFMLGSSTPTEIAVDGNGNVVVAGGFDAPVDFNPGSGKATLTPAKAGSSHTEDIFVARYSTAGSYLWAFKVGSTGHERAASLGLDGSGNVYLTGWFGGTMDFNPSNATANLAGPGVFIARYSTAGAYVWAKKIAGYFSSATTLTVDGSGNVVLTGTFSNDTYDFDPGTGTATLTPMPGTSNLFVARYSSSGGYLWAFSPASAGWAFDIAITDDGDIYLTGSLAANTSAPGGFPNDFDPGPGAVSFTGRTGYVARYTSAGDYVWAFPLASDSLTASAADGDGVFVGDGNIYVTGSFRGTTDFDPSGATMNIPSAGSSDIFIAIYTQPNAPKRAVHDDAGTIEMALSPNPFTDRFTIGYTGTASTARIDVVDIMGRVVESYDDLPTGGQVDLGSDLPAGTYVVQITQGETRRQLVVHKVR